MPVVRDRETGLGAWYTHRAGRLGVLLPSSPFLGRAAGDEANVGDRFAGQWLTAGEPIVHAPGPGVVGRGRKAEIAELAIEVTQQLRRFGDGLAWVEGILKATLPCRSGHKLRDALRPLEAHGAGVEAALLPDQPDEEICRQLMTRGHCGERIAHGLRRRGGRSHRRAVGLGAGFALILGLARLGRLCRQGIFCKCGGSRHYEDSE